MLLPDSAATILAIWLRRWLSSSCSSVVRLSAGKPGFFKASSFSSCFLRLGTEAFRCITVKGLGFHLCFSGRVSLLWDKNLLVFGPDPLCDNAWPPPQDSRRLERNELWPCAALLCVPLHRSLYHECTTPLHAASARYKDRKPVTQITTQRHEMWWEVTGTQVWACSHGLKSSLPW